MYSQLGVTREGYPSVWFDCPASKAFATAQYICYEYDAKMIDFAGVLGYIPPSLDAAIEGNMLYCQWKEVEIHGR